MPDSFVSCPHCGGEILEAATFCRHCGSSESDGWRDDAEGGFDDEFDYDSFVEENFSTSAVNKKTPGIWRAVAAMLLMLIGLFALMQIMSLLK